MPNGSKTPQVLPAWLWLLLASVLVSVLCVSWMLANGWLHFATHSLLWDLHQTTAISYAGLAVLFAIVIVVGMRRLYGSTSTTVSESDVARRLLVVRQLFAWALLFLSYTLSEMRSDWHIARPIYFGLAFIAIALVSSTNFLYARQTKSRMYALLAIVWLGMLVFLVTKFFWGPSSEGLFK